MKKRDVLFLLGAVAAGLQQSVLLRAQDPTGQNTGTIVLGAVAVACAFLVQPQRQKPRERRKKVRRQADRVKAIMPPPIQPPTDPASSA